MEERFEVFFFYERREVVDRKRREPRKI